MHKSTCSGKHESACTSFPRDHLVALLAKGTSWCCRSWQGSAAGLLQLEPGLHLPLSHPSNVGWATDAVLLIPAGDGVVELQRFLHSQGYITKLQETPDGYTGVLLPHCDCLVGRPVFICPSARLTMLPDSWADKPAGSPCCSQSLTSALL